VSRGIKVTRAIRETLVQRELPEIPVTSGRLARPETRVTPVQLEQPANKEAKAAPELPEATRRSLLNLRTFDFLLGASAASSKME
jgi:hypothetical protein